MAEEHITEKIDDDIELLSRHIDLLRLIRDNQPIGIIKISEMLNIPKHKIRYSLRLLEKDKVIEPSPDGARITAECDEYLLNMSNYLDKILSDVQKLQAKLTDSAE